MPKTAKNSADYILPLYINGLSGRMLRLPPKKPDDPEMLFVYGQHSNLERWWGLVLALNELGGVTMPDLPGVGGMTSLYKIGQAPTIDNLADYLAAFIKLRFRNKRVTIVGFSIGFAIATRMLQKYPELAKKSDFIVSVVGFSHHDDFIFSKTRITAYKIISKLLSRKIPAIIFKHTALQPFVIRTAYHRTFNAKEKFEGTSAKAFKETMDMEVYLWQINDVRSQFRDYLEMFYLDNTTKRVNLPVLHVAAKKDRYFNNVRVEEHMRRIFSDFEMHYSKVPNHAPTVIATAKEAAPFIPPTLKKSFKKYKR